MSPDWLEILNGIIEEARKENETQFNPEKLNLPGKAKR